MSPTEQRRYSATVFARPTRRDSYVILIATLAVCFLAPLNGVTFAFAGLAAIGLKQLSQTVRWLTIAASAVLLAIGVFTIVSN